MAAAAALVEAPKRDRGSRSGQALSYAQATGIACAGRQGSAGADDAARSLAAGALLPQTAPDTIADGLRTGLSERTFGIISEHVEAIVTVTEEGAWQVEQAGGHGSHLLADLARANALVILPEDVDFVAAGDDVDVWLLGEKA